MKIIVCLDNHNGMMFNNRRQSSDRVLRKRILDMVQGTRLWMNMYSAKQFGECSAAISVDENFLSKADKGEYCFLENVDILPFQDEIEAVFVYRWNTVYPSDVQFPVTLLKDKTPVSVTSFVGHSHPLITEEIYEW